MKLAQDVPKANKCRDSRLANMVAIFMTIWPPVIMQWMLLLSPTLIFMVTHHTPAVPLGVTGNYFPPGASSDIATAMVNVLPRGIVVPDHAFDPASAPPPPNAFNVKMI